MGQSTKDQFGQLLAETAGQSHSLDQQPVAPFLEWSQNIPTARGISLDFKRFPYQPESYRVFGDIEVEDACSMKGTQVGESEKCTRAALYFSDQYGATCLYVFPALKQMYEYASSRVDPLVERSTYLQGRTQLGARWPWSKGLKRIGSLERSGFVHFRGSESKRDLISVDADVLVLDEYDMLDPRNVPEAERRIGASNLGLIRRIGVPSDPEFGIAKRYRESDGRMWMVTCDHCGRKQPIKFHRNEERSAAFVKWEESDGIVENPRIICGHCEKPVNVLVGEWVAEWPERPRPGFHIHRLMVAGERNLLSVIENSKKRSPTEIRAFWNSDLGLPHADSEAGLDRSVLQAAISAAESMWGRPLLQSDFERATGTGGFLSMGVDVASARNLNVRISLHPEGFGAGHRKVGLRICEAESFDDVVNLMHLFRINVCVIDSMPETRMALSLAARFPGRVFLCNYAANQAEPLVLKPDDQRVSVIRTVAMDTTVDLFRQMRNLLCEDLPEGYVEQMVAPRRVVTTDEFDRSKATWESRGPSDYFQAETYDMVATEVLKVLLQMQAQHEGVGDFVQMEGTSGQIESALSNPDRGYQGMTYQGQTQPEDLMRD